MVWLMHVSAIVGMALGYETWFIEKTPMNLLVSAGLLVVSFPVTGVIPVTLFSVFFGAGFVAEWVGVNTGLLFGNYAYGANMGVKAGGVPLLIGINWAVLVFITGAITDWIKSSIGVKIVAGAAMMVLLDVLMEKSAPAFDFWSFRDGVVPAWNYICWFLLAALLHGLFHRFRLKGDVVFSANLLAANFAFFLWCYVR